ncbi:MAG: DEAD/DEAH box helicase [Cyanobacteria bacterium P01_A01_bin.68]
MSELLLWQLAYHLSGSTLLGITEQEPLGTLPIPIRTAVLKTVKQFNQNSIDLRLNQKSPLDFAEGEYEWVESWNYKNSSQPQPNLEKLLYKLPQRYSTYQKVALELLRQAVENNKSHLVVADFQPSIPSFALAILDLVGLIERVSQLYKLHIALPKVEIYLMGSVDVDVIELLNNYRSVDLNETSNFIDSPQTSVRFLNATKLPENVDFISVAESLNNNALKNSYSFNDLEKLANEFVDSVGDTPPLQAHPVCFERAIIDYFARRYFLIPELKQEQLELIQKALHNESILGLLPTGFGKSLIFQLYALLIPRTTLVISPLKALIRDQVNNLERTGLNCVESIISGETAKQRKIKLESLKFARDRMLYVSPERLQIGEFYDELKEIMYLNPVGALVIDEAHCVSEWGHDFRPAYLQIGRLQQTLEAASERKVPIIALTATASEQVRKDILRVLGLSQESIVQSPNSDRPNFSLSVHRVSEPEQKPRELARLIKEVIPEVLSIPVESISKEQTSYDNAGLIFGIYANSHGRRTFNEGVQHIAYELKKRLSHDDNLVQVHASTAPDLCPKCGSTAIQDENTENRRCLECGTSFTKLETDKISNWDKSIQQRQDDFQNNEFPLMVATKGYGMGIDKRNIRFVIHHSLSSSLEAYYQEAGRAGRDHQHAHVALMYHPPHSECQEKYINAGVAVQPPCVSEGKYFHFWKCPYFKEHLCDYGHQARFIRKHYQGLEKNIETVLEIYRSLIFEKNIVIIGDEKNNQAQIALYRLQQLGIVKEFTIKYHTLYKIEYYVDFNSEWNLKEVADSLKIFLIQTDVKENYAEAQINQSFKLFLNKPIQSIREQALTESLRILLERIYETVPRMRYQMLLNQLDYAKSDEEKICRRIVIRGIFDSVEHLLDRNYKCGFCDVCNPDLNFERNKAEVLTQEAQVDEIGEKLPNILERFDIDNLLEVLNLTIKKGAVAGLFARVTNRLERDPTNLAALYLAGALGRLRKGKESIAFEYLKFGFNEGIKQGLSSDNLLMFYQEAALLNPKEAFNWLTQVGGYWDNQAGLQFLIQEAINRFGIDSTQYRILLLLCKIRELNKVSDDSIKLKPGIENLKQGFERFS